MTDSATYIWATMCEPLTIMKDTDELKPCPFCGSDQIEIKIDEYAPEGHKVDWWMIHCLSCSAEYRNIHCDREGVLDGWNRRVSE